MEERTRKKIKGKVVLKHETEANWALSSYVPDNGEMVLYDEDATHNYKRAKYGDGIKKVKDLPFALSASDLNFKNGDGSGAIVQLDGGVTDSAGIPLKDKKPNNPTYYEAKATGKSAVAFNVRTTAAGDASGAGGYNANAYTKGDWAFNTGIAGLTEAEFNKLYQKGYYLSGSYLNYAEFKQKVVSSAFAINGGNAKGGHTFSAGGHNSEMGSWAPNSATFGEQCKTVYELDKEGNVIINATNSLVGGTICYMYSPNSIGYGKNLSIPAVIPKGESEPISRAVFGQFNYGSTEAIMQIGNGTSDSNKSNAFQVMWDGRAKVQSAPKDSDDAIRLEDIKSGEYNASFKSLKSSTKPTSDNEVLRYQDLNGGFAARFNTLTIGYFTGDSLDRARNSVAIGEHCYTRYQKDANGKDISNAQNSLVGGSVSYGYSPDSITFGRNLSTTYYKPEGSTDAIAKAAFGQNNVRKSTSILEIGNGTSDSKRSNAFEVLWDGRAKVYGVAKEENDVITQKYLGTGNKIGSKAYRVFDITTSWEPNEIGYTISFIDETGSLKQFMASTSSIKISVRFDGKEYSNWATLYNTQISGPYSLPEIGTYYVA